MKFKISLFIMILLIACVSVSAVSSIESEQIVDGLNSTSNLTHALSDAGAQNKTVMLLFDQDSCYYCDLLKSDVLSNPDVQKELNNGFIVVAVDVNKDSKLASDYKVVGTPMTVFLDSNSHEVNRIEGYVSADEFLSTLKEI